METQTIYILIATTDCRILQNDFFQQLETSEDLQLIVSNQNIHSDANLVWEKPFTQVIQSKTKGISNNRNELLLAVKNKKGIALIADDDVSYVPDFQDLVRNNYVKNIDFAVLTFQIKTPESVPYKKYQTVEIELDSNSLLNRHKTLSISSIEITFDIEKVSQTNVMFDTKLGIGSEKYVGGEEVIFLQELLHKSLKIKYIPTYLVIHPLESSGKNYSLKLMETFAVVFKKTYGILAYPFILYFALKKRNQLQNVSLWKIITKMCSASW